MGAHRHRVRPVGVQGEVHQLAVSAVWRGVEELRVAALPLKVVAQGGGSWVLPLELLPSVHIAGVPTQVEVHVRQRVESLRTVVHGAASSEQWRLQKGCRDDLGSRDFSRWLLLAQGPLHATTDGRG